LHYGLLLRHYELSKNPLQAFINHKHKSYDLHAPCLYYYIFLFRYSQKVKNKKEFPFEGSLWKLGSFIYFLPRQLFCLSMPFSFFLCILLTILYSCGFAVCTCAIHSVEVYLSKIGQPCEHRKQGYITYH
jgi:hypothetical protein